CSSMRSGTIPLELQPNLVRVLQEQEFERLGSTRTKEVNVRIVAATHRGLEGRVLERQFRRDLYCRLNVFPIRIPPLRERREDMPLLVGASSIKRPPDEQDHRVSFRRDNGHPHALPLTRKYPGTGERHRTRSDYEPWFPIGGFTPRP